MSGFLDTASKADQTEALYIAYFDRAGDAPGEDYWANKGGSTLTLTETAQSFAVQPEAAALGVPTDPTNPIDSAIVVAFIQNVYNNLFSRLTDAAGQAYWQGQISSGAVSIGSAVVDIANGAQASDASRLGYKIQAATTFTEETATAGINTSDPTFMAAAHAAVVNVVNSVGLNASMLATYNYTHPGANVQLAGQAQGTTPGFLDTQPKVGQTEALYIAYFDRAGDAAGTDYWANQGGSTLTATQTAQSFAVQPEAAALHIPTDPTNATAITTFIQGVYSNLFSHSADAPGVAYWQGQIASGAVSIGAAVVAIANGAQTSDAYVLNLKITAATSFTGGVFQAHLGPSDPGFFSAAHAAVVDVVDTASLSAAQSASYQYTHPSVQLVGQAHDTHPTHG